MNGKRILICCNRTMSIGGIERSLTSFLRVLDTKNNEVLLVLHDQKGTLHKELPLDGIEVFYVDSIDPSSILTEDIKHFRFLQVIRGIWNRAMLRLESDWYARIMYTYRIIQRKLRFPGHFDCAISFTTDYSDLSMIVAADADKRVCFVHGDATQGRRAARLNNHLLRKLDKVYCVSAQAKELFLQAHPHCVESADILHNVILPEDILSKADEPADGMLLDETPAICTVGRLSPEKGQQLIPEVAQLLLSNGYRFRWYVVGDGPLRPQLQQLIDKLKLHEHIILLGYKSNPYPYIKNCNIYVQTSLSEAYCLTVAEARILCRPIVTTDAPGLREQIVHGENGLITASMTPQALANEISSLLAIPQICARFIEHLKNASTEETPPLQKLYDFIEA